MGNNFTGEHSEILINLDHVLYAKSEGPSGGDIRIKLITGEEIILQNGTADMFRSHWRNYNSNE